MFQTAWCSKLIKDVRDANYSNWRQVNEFLISFKISVTIFKNSDFFLISSPSSELGIVCPTLLHSFVFIEYPHFIRRPSVSLVGISLYPTDLFNSISLYLSLISSNLRSHAHAHVLNQLQSSLTRTRTHTPRSLSPSPFSFSYSLQSSPSFPFSLHIFSCSFLRLSISFVTHLQMSDRPSKSDAHSDRSFDEGTLLWVSLEGFPWWPARVIHESECNFASLKVDEIPPHQVLIMFFNDNNRFCLTDKEKTIPFRQDKNLKRFARHKGKYRASLMGAIKEALALYNGQDGDGQRSSPRSNLLANSASEIQLLTSPSSSHVQNSSPAPDRRRKPVRRNSVSLETGHRRESNGDDEKNTKRKDKRRSSDGIPPTRGKPRGKRVHKTEDRLNVKDELHIPRPDKVQKPHRKRPHSPVSDDDNESDAGNRPADRASKSEFRKKSVGLNSTRADERGSEERSKRRRTEDDPYANLSLDDIGIPRRKTEDDHRASSPKRDDDFRSNPNSSRKDDTQEEPKAPKREEKGSWRRKEAEGSHDDPKKIELVVNDKQHRGATNARKRSPKEGLKEAQSRNPDDLNDYHGPERRQEKGRDKSDEDAKITLIKPEAEPSSGMLLGSPPCVQIRKSSDVRVKGNPNQSSNDHMSDDENHLRVDTVSGGQGKTLPKSEDSGDDMIGTKKKGLDAAHQTSGTWDLERIADYVPDKSLTQPRSSLSQEQLLVLLAQRETELRRCRLQLWRADCKLKKDRLASSTEVEMSLKRIEELVRELVDWACTRPKRNQDEKRRTSDWNDSRVYDYSEHLLEDDKVTFGEKVRKICEEAHDIGRIRFDPNKVDTKSLAERLFLAMQRAMKVSRRASFALKDMVSLWADIYMFSEIEKKQAAILDDEKGPSKPLQNRREENDLAQSDASDHDNDVVLEKVVRNKNDSDQVDARTKNKERGSRILSPRRGVRRGSRLNDDEKLKRHESKNPVESRRDTKLGVSHGKWSPYDDREHTLVEVDKTGTNEISSESGAHSVEEGQPNGKDLAKRQGGRKAETASRPGRIGRPQSTLNGTADKLSDPVGDSGHSTSGDELNRKSSGQRHSDKDQDRRGSSKRNRSGTRKGSDKQSGDDLNRAHADDTGLDGDSKAGKAALKSRKNGSNSGDDRGGVVLSKERQKALDKLRSQMRTVRNILTMPSGDRGADVHAMLEMTEKLVFKRCANENANGYNQSINSVLRAIQQLARKCNGDNVAKLVEEDEVAAALKECFASVRNDLSTAVEEFLKLCLEQPQTVVEGNRERER